MTRIHQINISPPLINTSCAWASELHELEDLFNSPHTGGVTTRTATLTGFAEDSSHTVGPAIMYLSPIASDTRDGRLRSLGTLCRL